MSKRYFGTDGIRGTVGTYPITPEFMLRLGQSAGRVLSQQTPGRRATVLIGKDTRVSGYMLEAALEAGFSSVGVDVVLCGPLPTPAVAYLTRATAAVGRRRDQRFAQPVPGQRHQVLLGKRQEAR